MLWKCPVQLLARGRNPTHNSPLSAPALSILKTPSKSKSMTLGPSLVGVKTWVSILAFGYVTLGKSHRLSEPVCPALE